MRSPNPQGEPAPTSPPTIDLSPANHRAVPSLAPAADPSVVVTPFDEQNTVPHSLALLSTPGWSGRAFGRYEVLAEIAQGGMGIVYRVRDTLLRRVVALKMIRSGALASADEVERFFREAKAVAQLRHPHIVTIHDFGQIEGNHYFTMDLAEGGSLAAHLARFTAAPRDTVALLMKVARAVEAVHEHALVHRDLKPANILLQKDDDPLVTDFGLAKLAEAEELTQTGAAPGTPAYMAPEQARADKAQIGPHTDVWALGVILYEVLTGRKPFPGPGRDKITSDILSTDPPRPRSLQRGLDKSLETILLKCLEKDPSRRYPSAGALADDLGCWLRGEPVRARSLPWWARSLRRARKQPRLVVGGTLLAVIALAVAFTLYFFDADRPERLLREQLLGGNTVTLIGPTGPPKWLEWGWAKGVLVESPFGDRAFSMDALHQGYLELLKADPQRKPYRLSAEVRHNMSAGMSEAGMYFGHRRHVTHRGTEHCYCVVSFADSGAYLRPDAGGRLAKGWVRLRLHDVLEDGASSGPQTSTEVGPRFEYTAPAGEPPWRRLALEVRKEGIGIIWNGARVADMSRKRMTAIGGTILKESRLPAALEFDECGALGLYVQTGAASFRNVIVEPIR